MTDPPKGTRVAAYYRCSTDGQEHSIPGQKGVVRKEQERRGWVLVGEYEDEGESGAVTNNRLGLQKLLSDAAAKQFDLVVMYDVSRITRGGVKQFWTLVTRFEEAGVRLFCCALGKVASESNASEFTSEADQARKENIKRSKNATRGLHQSIFDRDNDPGRRPPFGYDQMRVEITTGKPVERIRFLRDGTKLIMPPVPNPNVEPRVIPKGEEYRKGTSLRTVLVPGDPEDVETVRRIFREARLYGLRRLADSLNLDGLRSSTGELWSSSSLRDVLMNEAYIGWRVTNKVSKARYHRHGRDGVEAKEEHLAGPVHLVRRPKEEQNVWKGKHEPLVAEAVFFAAQEARERRQGDKTWNRKGRDQDREYLFSSKFITCLRCGAGLNGTIGTTKGHRYAKYYCSTNRRHGRSACAGYSVPMDSLDEFVLNAVCGSVMTPDCLSALAAGLEAEFARRLEQQRPMSKDETDALKTEQAEIERTRRQIADAVRTSPAAIELMKPEIERLAAQAEALKRKQRQAKPALDKAKIKELVAQGLAFYQEKVLGPMAAAAPNKGKAVVKTGKTNVSEERAGTKSKRPAGASGNATAGTPNSETERPCTAELKELLRLLGLKLTYDPDKKEGTLEFDPFARYATG